MNESLLRIISYDEWIVENPDVKLEAEDCIECGGSGEKECWNCGNVEDCENCGGTGKVNSARSQYDKHRKHDEKLLNKYLDSLKKK